MLATLQGIGKVYGTVNKFRALEGVNVQIAEGEFIAIIGQSGSGKSTLLNILGLLDLPTEGSLTVQGKAIARLSEDEITRLRSDVIGFIFQFHYLLPDFTVLENVLMPVASTGKGPTKAHVQEALEVLDRMGIKSQAKKLANQISGGQQQRAAIGRALMGRKPLILADEPTGNLDSVTGAEVFELMRELNREWKTTFVIVTHDLRIAEQCDRIIRIADGLVVEDRLVVASVP
jgi:lipoprotein-releasing system ATP-binding protein